LNKNGLCQFCFMKWSFLWLYDMIIVKTLSQIKPLLFNYISMDLSSIHTAYCSSPAQMYNQGRQSTQKSADNQENRLWGRIRAWIRGRPFHGSSYSFWGSLRKRELDCNASLISIANMPTVPAHTKIVLWSTFSWLSANLCLD
jgi:hypothetical protein